MKDRVLVTYLCKCGIYKVEETEDEFYTTRLELCPVCKDRVIMESIEGGGRQNLQKLDIYIEKRTGRELEFSHDKNYVLYLDGEPIEFNTLDRMIEEKRIKLKK